MSSKYCLQPSCNALVSVDSIRSVITVQLCIVQVRREDSSFRSFSQSATRGCNKKKTVFPGV